jgi:lycopene cyclase domain-containing protein
MMPIYFYILLASISIPALYSLFVNDFIVHWKNFIFSTGFIAIVYLIWDVIFAYLGIWGFNHDYCLGIYFFKLPLEEILFFFIIPFCSLFIHYAFNSVLPDLKISARITHFLAYLIIAISCIIVLIFYTKAYTLINGLFLIGVLLIGLKYHLEHLQKFFITFLIILIPFIIVNGILTGAITESPIVWYDNTENLGFRIISIPIEDFAYAFSMLFGNLMIFEYLNSKKKLENEIR